MTMEQYFTIVYTYVITWIQIAYTFMINCVLVENILLDFLYVTILQIPNVRKLLDVE